MQMHRGFSVSSVDVLRSIHQDVTNGKCGSFDTLFTAQWQPVGATVKCAIVADNKTSPHRIKVAHAQFSPPTLRCRQLCQVCRSRHQPRTFLLLASSSLSPQHRHRCDSIAATAAVTSPTPLKNFRQLRHRCNVTSTAAASPPSP